MYCEFVYAVISTSGFRLRASRAAFIAFFQSFAPDIALHVARTWRTATDGKNSTGYPYCIHNHSVFCGIMYILCECKSKQMINKWNITSLR